MNITSGQLNKRFTFQSPSTTPGEGITTYTDSFTVWGAYWPLTGNRRYQAQQLDSSIAGTVIIRHRTGVRTSMRIKYGDRYLGIISIRNPKESNKFLEIDVKEYQD